MCWTEDEVKRLMKEFKLDELPEILGTNAGGLFDYGEEDFKDVEKRKKVITATLRGIADMIDNPPNGPWWIE